MGAGPVARSKTAMWEFPTLSHLVHQFPGRLHEVDLNWEPVKFYLCITFGKLLTKFSEEHTPLIMIANKVLVPQQPYDV
jgi:hypothetical protein